MASSGTARATKTFPRRGEIYLTAFDPALGHEIEKTRPALVIQNDVTNRFGATAIVGAITSTVSNPPYPNEVVLDSGGAGLSAVSTVRLDQIRAVDRQRLIRRLGKVDAATMARVDPGDRHQPWIDPAITPVDLALSAV